MIGRMGCVMRGFLSLVRIVLAYGRVRRGLMEKEKLMRILDEAEEFAGRTRSMLDDYQEKSKVLRAKLHKVFEEVRSVKKRVVTVDLGKGNCRSCGLLFNRDSLDLNSLCERCVVKEAVL